MLCDVDEVLGRKVCSAISDGLSLATVSERDADRVVTRLGGLFDVTHVVTDVEGVSVE